MTGLALPAGKCPVGHAGTACGGGGSQNYDLARQPFSNLKVYRCLTSGSEPNNLPIAGDDYYNLFVR